MIYYILSVLRYSCASCVTSVLVFVFWFFVFFQAEDGIRDLVRSRGLGDVYKRQEYNLRPEFWLYFMASHKVPRLNLPPDGHVRGAVAVSYTHLTLPTSDLV